MNATETFRFTRLDGNTKRRCETLGDVMSFDLAADERWLFVSPHDDDVCIGAGLLTQAAVREGIDVRIAVVSDGRMGYCTLAQRDGIIGIRARETSESFETLGIAK